MLAECDLLKVTEDGTYSQHYAYRRQMQLLYVITEFGVTLMSHRWSWRPSCNNSSIPPVSDLLEFYETVLVLVHFVSGTAQYNTTALSGLYFSSVQKWNTLQCFF